MNWKRIWLRKGVIANVYEKVVNEMGHFVCDAYRCDKFSGTRRFG